MKWKAYWFSVSALLVGGLYWINCRRYRNKSIQWKIGKSGIEAGIISLSAWLRPPILIGWTVLWFCRPIREKAFEIPVAAVAAAALAPLSAVILEVLLLASVFSIDGFTARFLDHWKRLGAEDQERRAA